MCLPRLSTESFKSLNSAWERVWQRSTEDQLTAEQIIAIFCDSIKASLALDHRNLIVLIKDLNQLLNKDEEKVKYVMYELRRRGVFTTPVRNHS